MFSNASVAVTRAKFTSAESKKWKVTRQSKKMEKQVENRAGEKKKTKGPRRKNEAFCKIANILHY